MNILFTNHTGHMSGAEHSLLSLLRELAGEASFAVAVPPGAVADAIRDAGFEVRRIPATDGSLKLHPVYTARALAQLGGSALAIRRAASEIGAEVVHANSIRSGLSATAVARGGGPPAVTYVHDCLPPGRVSSITRDVVGNGSAVVVANSGYTRDRFAKPSFSSRMRVVHYGLDAEHFSPERIGRPEARTRLGLEDGDLVLALVAQLTPWKGQDDAVRALATLRGEGLPGQLLLVGSAKFVSKATRYDNRAYVRGLEQLAESLRVGDAVHFLGERADVPEVLRAADLALVPSWEEPFGRAVIEAMAMEVPVLATEVGGPAEIVSDGEDGLLLPPRRPERWARAVVELARDRKRLDAMGASGRRRVIRDFGMRRYAERMLDAYADARRGR